MVCERRAIAIAVGRKGWIGGVLQLHRRSCPSGVGDSFFVSFFFLALRMYFNSEERYLYAMGTRIYKIVYQWCSTKDGDKFRPVGIAARSSDCSIPTYVS